MVEVFDSYAVRFLLVLVQWCERCFVFSLSGYRFRIRRISLFYLFRYLLYLIDCRKEEPYQVVDRGNRTLEPLTLIYSFEDSELVK